jgi:hypothetical protein
MRPSPITDLIQLRVMSAYLSDQYLAWSYTVMANPELWQPWMSYLNLSRVPRSPAIDDQRWSAPFTAAIPALVS